MLYFSKKQKTKKKPDTTKLHNHTQFPNPFTKHTKKLAWLQYTLEYIKPNVRLSVTVKIVN